MSLIAADEGDQRTPTPADTGSDGSAALTARDVQRQTLADLIHLATDCASVDAQIERRLIDASTVAEKALKAQAAKLTAASVDEIAAAQAARQRDLQQIESAYAADRARIDGEHQDVRRRATSEYDTVGTRIKKEYQDQRWMVESVLDSAVIGAEKAHKAAMEQTAADRAAVDKLRDDGLATLHRYNQQHLAQALADLPRHEDLPADAFGAAKAELERSAKRLDALPLARLFVGAWPFLAGLLIVGGAVAATRPWQHVAGQSWGPTIYAGVGAAVFVGVVGFLVLRVSHRQIRATWATLVDALARAHSALDRRMVDAAQLRDDTIRQANAQHEADQERVRNRFQPMADKAKAKRDEMIYTAKQTHERDLAARTAERARLTLTTQQQHEQAVDALEAKRDKAIADATATRDRSLAEARTACERARAELQERWDAGLAATKAQNAIQSAASSVRVGAFTIDLARIIDESGADRSKIRLQPPPPYEVPAWISMPRQASLLIEHDRTRRDDAIELLRATMFNLLTTLPPGRVKFTLIDPVGLGQSFAAFMHLADYDDSLVGGRIWSESDDIEKRLADLTEHMETVIQKYLRNEFTTIDEYNAQAGELAEPYRFLVIADLPTSFSDESLRRLANIATTGARCGVYVLVSRDTRSKLAPALIEDLHNSCTTIQQKSDRFVWRDAIFGRFDYAPATRPGDDAMTDVMHTVGRGAKDNQRVAVPFDIVAPQPQEMWSLDSSQDVAVPVGRTGATRLQTFRLGRGVAQHALIAGKTGSGKSTLLNVLITNLAMWYSPDQLELYLIDFKRGVEFKMYANRRLPHARAIAVESDREFGLSVLQRLDAEIARRGELYRKVGAQDVASYRKASGQPLPRILLVVDEFQEIFTEDDRISQEAATLFDRLVRQGRAFGIHVVLGSQTIGGSTTLPRTTMGQMAVRVALQTTEADSQLILGDNNSAARLLTRPGEAIYNDAGGAVENNSPFQITWLADEERDAALRRVRDLADERRQQSPSCSVFEGNAPAHLEDNRELIAQLQRRPTLSAAPPMIAAAVGEAVAIKPPTAVSLRRRAGANVLIVGQQDEQAAAVMATMAISVAAQVPANAAEFRILDATPADSALYGKLPGIARQLPTRADEIGYRAVPEAIVTLADELKRRQEANDESSPSIFLLINGLQRYRELRKTEEAGFSFSMGDDAAGAPKPQAADKAFAELIREGPPFGIHVIAWVDTQAALDRTLERAMLREFDHRVLFQMSAADSSHLIDSPAANKLGSHRAIYFSEEQGIIEKFRPYGLVGDAFMAERFASQAT